MHPFFERIGGWILQRNRGHDKLMAWNTEAFAPLPDTLLVTSPAFRDGARIPKRYAGYQAGDNVSPPLAWSNVPAGTVELAIIMEDPDAPVRQPIIHFTVAGIPPHWTGLEEGAIRVDNPDIRVGKAAYERMGYHGPRPVRGHGVHRYIFQLVALATQVDPDATVDAYNILEAAKTAGLAKGRLTGTYIMD